MNSQASVELRGSTRENNSTSTSDSADPNKSRPSSKSVNTSKAKKVFEEDEDENPVLSVDNLTQWLINFSSSASFLMKQSARFFRDEFNVLRDSQWRPIRESENPMAAAATFDKIVQDPISVERELNFQDIQNILDKTGCINLPIVLFEQDRSHNIKRFEKAARRRSSARTIPKLEEDTESGGVYRRHCLFLSDWQRLFNYLKHDPQDEVAQHAPFLRTCVEFFFHRRTVQFMYFLIGWNLGVSIFAQVLFPNAIPVYNMNFNYAYYIFQLAVYLTACLMNKGTLPKFFEINLFKKAKKNNDFVVEKPDLDEKLTLNAREHHVHWGSTARQIVRKTGSEIVNFFQTAKEEAEANRNFSRRGMYYYKWMNMMLKTLSRLNGIQMDKTNFNRQIYRFVLIFSTAIFPIYTLFTMWESYIINVVSSCGKDDTSIECDYYFVIMAGTGGYITLWLQYYIYGASVLISLCGLAYGGEIAYRLADGWLQKYGCLRRVDDIDSCYVDRGAINKVEGSSVDDMESRKREQMGRSMRIANGFRISSNPASMSTEETERQEVIEQGAKEIAGLISRDATEQYLFIREAMNTAGRIWSPVITGLIFLAIFIAIAEVYSAYYATTRGYSNVWIFIRLTAFVIVRILILVFYPIVSIATANAYLLKIADVFRVSAEEDYEVIGGRDRWLEFLEKFPAVWTYYGVYVTPERLAGIAWTTFIAFLSVVFTALASTSL